MKALVVGLVLACLLISPSVRADTPDDQYVNIYSLIDQGDTLGEKGNADGARKAYTEALKQLKQLQADNPLWNVKTVKFRIDYLTAKLTAPAGGTGTLTGGTSVNSTPPPGINANEPVDFKIKWQAGKQYKQRMDMTINVDMKVSGSAQAVKTVTTSGQAAVVRVLKETDGGGHELELELQSLQMGVKMGAMTMASFDSQKDSGSSNPLAFLKKLIGAKFTAQADPSGKIATVEGVQAALKGLNAESVPGGQEMISQIVSENSLKEFFDQGDELAGHPVKIGDTWTATHDAMKEMGPGKMELQIKFRGWSDHNGRKCAVFEYTGKITGGEGDSGATPMKVEDGRISGTSWFDPVLGQTVDTTGKVEMSAKINAQGQNMSAKFSVAMGRKILEVTDAK